MAIMEGRHPLVEQIQEADYQPNDTYLAGEDLILFVRAE